MFVTHIQIVSSSHDKFNSMRHIVDQNGGNWKLCGSALQCTRSVTVVS